MNGHLVTVKVCVKRCAHQRMNLNRFWPLTDLRVAFFGPAWGHDRMLEGFEGEQRLVVRPADVDVPPVEGA